jgi:sortase A
LPDSSTPDQGGNTVITGHRFKYLPPNNLTFYLFDKLAAGDIISVIWHEQEYYYRIKETKIVDKTETSILNQTREPILTLFTCHPIYSEENRLVVIAEPVAGEENNKQK